MVGAIAFFELDGLHVTSDVLGSSVRCDQSGVRCKIDFPKDNDDFSVPFVSAIDGDSEDSGPPSAVHFQNGRPDVRIVRVIANLDIADPWDPTDKERGVGSFGSQLDAACTAAVTDLCNWARVLVRQHWMEPSGRLPRLISSQVIDLTDEDAEERASSMAFSGLLRVMDPEAILDANDLARIEHAMSTQSSPSVDDVLLADARHLVSWTVGATVVDRSVLLAASAVEIRTRRTLMRLALPEQERLVDALINNPRDWSVGAHGTFLKAVPAVGDRS